MKKKLIVKILFLSLTCAFFFAGCNSKSSKTSTVTVQRNEVKKYTCPMHPQIVRETPGKCPICGMDLVPKQAPGEVTGIDTGLSQLLKPVNEQVIAKTATVFPESGTRIFSIEVQGSITYDTRRQTSIASRVGGRIERLYVKYNFQPIKKGQLITEIYSPDLAAAQRELVYLSRSGKEETLLQKAKQRLILLGMRPDQISQVLKTGRILYNVPVYSAANGYILDKTAVNNTPASMPSANTTSSGNSMSSMGSGNGSSMASNNTGTSNAQAPKSSDNTPVLIREGQYVTAGQSLFTIYNNTSLVAEFAFNPSIAPNIKKGQKLVFRKISDPEAVFTGSIGLIQPVFRSGERFTIARVYMSDTRFQIGQYVTANIPVLTRGWWVPSSAVYELGNSAIVFKKEGNVFIPKAVKKGISIEGLTQITDGVSGWEIAKNASYLVDSESFIRINSNPETSNANK